MQRILELSKMLGISDFIEQLPSGYNSLLGEQGVNLSGGQRQRIAIARALYRNPEILILDEATSNLDQLSESKVQTTLEWFKSKGKTIILIAHRLNTIRNCDEILVLKEGKLVEKGTHNILSINTESYYYKFWKTNN